MKFLNTIDGASSLTTDPLNRLVTDADKASWNNKSEIPYVVGTQTVTTASWTGVADTVDSLYDGLSIRYWLPRTSASSVTLNLTLKGGGTTGPINCYYGGTTRLTTHYPAGSFLILTYVENQLITGVPYTGWWAQADYIDGNNYDRTYWGNAITAGAPIYSYKILMQDSDGKFYPLTLETGTGITKTISTQDFVIDSTILHYITTTTVASNGTTTNVYTEYPVTTLNYTANQASWVSQQQIYLKGKIQANGAFKLDNTSYTSFMTQTLPTTEDGFVYILLGYMYSTTGMRLFQYHPVYEFRNGSIRKYVPVHSHGTLTDDGKIGATSGLVVQTGTGGVIGAKTAGSASQFLNGLGAWATPPNDNTTYGVFTSSVNGLVPLSGGGTTKYLRADGTFQVPPDNNTTYGLFNTAVDGLVPKTTTSNTVDFLRRDGTWATPPETVYSVFTSVDGGIVPLSGGGTTKYLRADGTWVVPPDINTWRDIDDVPVDGVTTESISSNWAFDHNAGVGNNKHVPAAGSAGQFLAYNGAWATPPDNNTTYSVFTSTVNGLVPLSGAGTTKYLRQDGTWVVPTDNDTTYGVFTSVANGLVPLSGGGTTKYLRADGTFQVPPNDNTVYSHPTYSYAAPTDDSNTTLSTVDLISTLTQTNGHVTGGTKRNLVAGTNVTIVAESDGDIVINSSYTDTNTIYSHPNHTGDVTSAGDGALTIVNDKVTNAKLSNMAVNTIKGRATADTGDPEDLSATQVKAILGVFTWGQLKGV